MPSSRYQSRVLQVLAQQSMQIRDRVVRRARQARLAFIWGVQVVLYPVYVLFQSTRWLGQRLEQATRHLFPTISAAIDPSLSHLFSPLRTPPGLPPQSDDPIETLLDVLGQLAVPLTGTNESTINTNININIKNIQSQPSISSSSWPALAPAPDCPPLTNVALCLEYPDQHGFFLPTQTSVRLSQCHHPSAQGMTHKASLHDIASRDSNIPQSFLPLSFIQGIATLLHEKQLVLVDHQNITHNVLTTDQQAYLQQQIVLAVADYWYHRRQYLRLNALTQNHMGQRFLSVPGERETMLLPVRYLRRFIGWMQQGPIAIAANLFQESALISPSSGPSSIDRSGFNASGSSPSVDHQRIRDRSSALLEAHKKIQMGISPGQMISPGEFMGQCLKPSPLQAVALSSRPHPSRWEQLITWIVNMTTRSNHISDHLAKPSLTKTLQPRSQSMPNIPDQWHQQDQTVRFGPQNQKTHDEGWFQANQITQERRRREFPLVIPSLPTRVFPITVQSSGVQVSDIQISDMDTRTVPINAQFTEILTDVKADGLVGTQNLGAIRSQSVESATTILNVTNETPLDSSSTDPPLLEISAEIVGYEEHFLVKILGWLDAGIAWVEEHIICVWHWLRDRL